MTKKYIQAFKSKLATGVTLEPEELQDFFSRLEGDLKDKKYGLVWESQAEQVIEQLKTNKVYMEEEQDLKITQDPDNPKSNILIEGDNYEALTYLNEINQKVDVIYIDPPYNTGNKDFIYNDRYIDKEDGFKHSQWLSFMDARLRLARELLTDEGVIFISIDDNELYQLKLLCDQVFGENNFVNNFMWLHGKGKKTHQSRTLQQYNLCYAKNIRKQGEWVEYKELNYKFSNPDNDPKGDWFSGSVSFSEKRSNPNSEKFYEVESPSGIKWNRQWMVTKEEMEKLIDSGDIYFGDRPTFNKVPRRKIRRGKDKVIPNNIIKDVGTTKSATTELDNMLGEGKFDYPKPVGLVKHLISIVTDNKKDATVLDFFAGSGTTGHAVLELNKEDGGNRQFILVTNNENNIARDVTYERNKRVIDGYTTPKNKDVSGIPSNLAYYKTKQVSKYAIDFDEVVLQHVIPTIQLTEGVYSRTQHSPHITQLGDSIFIFTQYMVEDDEIDTLVCLVKDGDILYIQEGQVDYIKTKLPEGVVYKYLEDILPNNR